MDISLIDKNFKVDAEIDKRGLKLYSPDEPPFRIYGVRREGDRYRRLPEAVAGRVSEEVLYLHANTAGGRVRFVTDSRRFAVIARLDKISNMSHMPLCGSAGFDLYCDGVYKGTFRPPQPIPSGAYEASVTINATERRDRVITLNMPLYSDVLEFYIGIEEGATLSMAPDYIYESPVVYYGSSITQGGCASRAGNSYQGFISREHGCNFLNLGFSGSAKGEAEMADYIASLNMSAFVMDYDHNAPNAEFLRATHYPFYKRIREKQPDTPIILVTAPSVDSLDKPERAEVIRETYERALAEGDKHISFILGREMFPGCNNDFTVDNCHPTDLGFFMMAKAIGREVRRALDGKL